MQINSVNNYSYNKSCKTPNFKQGLTRDIVAHVKNMPSDEYKRITERLQNKYGMRADVGGSNVVAFCVEQTANIMKRAGFTLPKCFSFEPIDDKGYGTFESDEVVRINANYQEFSDLEQLNNLSENIIGIKSENLFLDTYLHEFLHAAHYGNLVKRMGKVSSSFIFFNELSDDIKPRNILLWPLRSFIKKMYSELSNKQITDLFPDGVNIFYTRDLTEYFAEKSNKTISERLGKFFNIANVKQELSKDYIGFPKNWSLENEINGFNNKSVLIDNIAKFLDKQLNYYLGEIWNGNISGIMQKSQAFGNYGKKHENK
jgi:hypothetical protein